jgi:hypothetical protein
MLLPKKKWLQAVVSPTGKAECSEDDLQVFADEFYELKRIKNIRIPNAVFRWLKMNASAHIQKWFFGLFGGWPDTLLLLPCGKYMLAVPIELKTQDKKGRPIGMLHGKQKHNSEYENWIIARSPEQIQAAVAQAEADCEKIKNILNNC